MALPNLYASRISNVPRRSVGEARSPLRRLLALVLGTAMLAACGGRTAGSWAGPGDGPATLAARLRPSAAAELRVAVAGPSAAPGYDHRTGVLTLPALPVVQPGGTSCFDAVLGVVSTDPVMLELHTAAAVACASGAAPGAATGAITAGARFDAATGVLSLPGLTVTGAAATTCYDLTLRHRATPGPVRLLLETAIERPCGGVTTSVFAGSMVLGAPTDRTVRLSVAASGVGGRAWLAWGRADTGLTRVGAEQLLQAGEPATFEITDLPADAEMRYRLYFAPAGGTVGAGSERRFHTARGPGSRFVFTVQADSHLDENSDLAVYERTLDNIAADAGDFHIDLGDTFMTEKHTEPFSAVVRMATDAATVEARYAYEHRAFGRMGHSTPLMLVNGNHDGELGWLRDGSERNLAIWATRARQRWFATPLPDAFYGGDTLFEPFVGERAAWYSWQWGDALFVVLDPFWNSARLPGNDGWGMTLGSRQYQWLAATLTASTARYRFVFIHNLVGGLDGQMRGGVEAAPYFEWGGRAADGTSAFTARRPGWALPIHELLVRHRVTAVFHGHDHLYARQTLDGIVYQEVPQPSARNPNSGATLARDYHYTSGVIQSSSGHLRVEVGPDGVQVRYVRSWLPGQETATRRNGEIADSWSVPAAVTGVLP